MRVQDYKMSMGFYNVSCSQLHKKVAMRLKIDGIITSV